MSAGFKAGDKVRTPLGETGTIVGPDPRPALQGEAVVVHWDKADKFGAWVAAGLTLIPDTVTVTVELPRDEAEMWSRGWSAVQPEDREPSLIVCRSVAAAIREALR